MTEPGYDDAVVTSSRKLLINLRWIPRRCGGNRPGGGAPNAAMVLAVSPFDTCYLYIMLIKMF